MNVENEYILNPVEFFDNDALIGARLEYIRFRHEGDTRGYHNRPFLYQSLFDQNLSSLSPRSFSPHSLIRHRVTLLLSFNL